MMYKYILSIVATIHDQRVQLGELQLLYLYMGSGSSSLRIQEGTHHNNEEKIVKHACRVLLARGSKLAARLLIDNVFEILEGTNDFGDDFYVLRTILNLEHYEHWRKLTGWNAEDPSYNNAFQEIAEVINEVAEPIYIRFIVAELDMSDDDSSDGDWRRAFKSATSGTTNQAKFTFTDGNKYEAFGINFRSKTEIKVYEALVKRGLFILPLPLAVLGAHNKKREPDFVVIYKGKTGVLEIHGVQWHPVEDAAKEADRRRQMRQLGVAVYEVFDAKQCWEDPDGVVSQFLNVFESP